MAGPMLPLMDKVGLELSLLSKFVLTCQSPRLSDAASVIGQTSSALSIALHGLEQKLGLKLFVRRAGGLDLLPSAFWLFRVGANLLYLEQHAREARPAPGTRPVRLSIQLDLDFAIGRVSKALLRTCQDLIAPFPELVIDWHFADLDDDNAVDTKAFASPEALPVEHGQVQIFYGENVTGKGLVPLYDDPWIVVGSRGSPLRETYHRDQLTVLRMRREVTAAIMSFAVSEGFAGKLQFRDEEPTQLAEILQETPHVRLLMPANFLPQRLGLSRHEEVRFEPHFTSTLHAQANGAATRYSRSFIEAMRRNLIDEQAVMFAPRLTTRQIHYFNLVAHTGGISAAARVSNTAQSVVSKHIGQMDDVMGTAVLRRSEEGATLSELGKFARPFIANIEERQHWIIRKSRDIAAHSEARVTIGTLPSSGHDSALTEKIAYVVTRIHRRHPDWQLQVLENSNAVLHERVRSGDLNLAVVGMVNTQVVRIRLGPTEPLSVIGNPAINFAGRKILGLEDVVALPLVLGPHHLSIHQNFAEAARERSLKLRPVIEVGSLPLAIAMVRQSPLCTILPASSVRQDIEAGRLLAVPIRQDELSGSLSIIFSAERQLSDAERTIVQEFVRVFRPGREAEPEDF